MKANAEKLHFGIHDSRQKKALNILYISIKIQESDAVEFLS